MTERERETEILYLLFTFRKAQELKLGWSEVAASSSCWVSTWVQGQGTRAEEPGPFCATFLDTLLGNWIRSKAARNPTRTYVGCQHCRPWLKPLYRSAYHSYPCMFLEQNGDKGKRNKKECQWRVYNIYTDSMYV